MKKILSTLAILSLASMSMAALPTAGDIIFTGIQADDEAFSFLTLNSDLDLRGLNYTDNEFTGTTGFIDQNEGEGTMPTDAGWNNVPAGTVVVIGNGIAADNDSSDGYLSAPYDDTNVALSSSGDSITIFAAAADYSNAVVGDIIAGGLIEDTAWTTHGNLDGLSLPSWAVVEGWAFDNAVYNGTVTSGTAEAVVAAIENTANWTTSNDPGTSFVTSFTLSSTLPVELDFFMVE